MSYITERMIEREREAEMDAMSAEEQAAIELIFPTDDDDVVCVE